MNLLEALDDPDLFQPWFRDRTTWKAWRAFLSALFGLPMTLTRDWSIRANRPLLVSRRGGDRRRGSFVVAVLASFRLRVDRRLPRCFRAYRGI